MALTYVRTVGPLDSSTSGVHKGVVDMDAPPCSQLFSFRSESLRRISGSTVRRPAMIKEGWNHHRNTNGLIIDTDITACPGKVNSVFGKVEWLLQLSSWASQKRMWCLMWRYRRTASLNQSFLGRAGCMNLLLSACCLSWIRFPIQFDSISICFSVFQLLYTYYTSLHYNIF